MKAEIIFWLVLAAIFLNDWKNQDLHEEQKALLQATKHNRFVAKQFNRVKDSVFNQVVFIGGSILNLLQTIPNTFKNIL